jgi:8-oxo-dGTP pyrophosphatase MutT (NUDIX family)
VYSRCISCRAHLGRNQALEAFQVGRRLAFDTHTGRLWALCAVCRTWNLSPIEERWEAVEEAERLFETAAIGSSTEHIALGRIAEGTELVRVGRADRQEFAGWRYSRKLIRRYRRYSWMGYASGGGAAALSLATGLGAIPLYFAAAAAVSGIHLRGQRPVLHTTSGETVRRGDAIKFSLRPGENELDWSVVIPRRNADDIHLRGDEALHALRALLPRANINKGRVAEVRNAVEEVVRLGSAEAVLREAAEEIGLSGGRRWKFLPSASNRPRPVNDSHPVIGLALEMAVNEEMERRALAGEVELLEREWQEAEELAAIADDLLFPRHLRERLRALKQAGAGRGRPSERVADLER